MSQTTNTNVGNNHLTVLPSEYYTLSFIERLLPSIYDSSDDATIIVTRHINALGLFRAAIVGRHQDTGLQFLLVGPLEGATRREALSQLQLVVEQLAARNLEAIVGERTKHAGEEKDELGDGGEEEEDEEDDEEDDDEFKNTVEDNKKSKGKQLSKKGRRNAQKQGQEHGDDNAGISTQKQKIAKGTTNKQDVSLSASVETMEALAKLKRSLRSDKPTKEPESKDKNAALAKDDECDESIHADIKVEKPKAPKSPESETQRERGEFIELMDLYGVQYDRKEKEKEWARAEEEAEEKKMKHEVERASKKEEDESDGGKKYGSMRGGRGKGLGN
ncbi:Nn.00g001820.m01.CDS01 [Neocucurbitaria sp. VM-36]